MKVNSLLVVCLLVCSSIGILLAQQNIVSETNTQSIGKYAPGELFLHVKTGTKLPIFKSESEISKTDLTSFPEWRILIESYDIYMIKPTFSILGSSRPNLRDIYTIKFNAEAKTEDLLNWFERWEATNLVEQVSWCELGLVPEDYYYDNPAEPGKDWHLKKVNAEAAWDITVGCSTVVIAVIDNAIDIGHPDLMNKIVSPRDVADNDDDPSPPACPSGDIDCFVHGTHVAGIAAAETNNNFIGVASLGFNSNIMPIKVTANNTSQPGGFATSTAVEAVEYAIANSADVINMSFGSPFQNTAFAQIISEAIGDNIICVAAAGNGNTSFPNYPAAYPSVISVGATDQNDIRAPFSNYGFDVDIMAPGVDIWSTFPTNASADYGYLSGTSMAAPMVSGLAALMLKVHPEFTPSTLQLCLQNNALDIDDINPLYAGFLGGGRIRADLSLTCEPSEENVCPPPLCELISNEGFEVFILAAMNGTSSQNPFGLSVNAYNEREICGWRAVAGTPHILPFFGAGDDNMATMHTSFNENTDESDYESIATFEPINIVPNEYYILEYDYLAFNDVIHELHFELTDGQYSGSGIPNNVWPLDMITNIDPIETGVQIFLNYIPANYDADDYLHRMIMFQAPDDPTLNYLHLYPKMISEESAEFPTIIVDNVQIKLKNFDFTASTDKSLIECDDPDPCATLTATGADSYNWYNNTDGLDLGGSPSIVVCPTYSTTYVATGFDNATGCSNSIEITIDVEQGPPIDIIASSTLITCDNPCVPLEATSSVDYNYTWTPDLQALNTNGSLGKACPTETTTYTVVGVDPLTGCSASASITIEVAPLPEIIITADVTELDCNPSCAFLQATGADTYSWAPASANIGSANSANTYVCPDETVIVTVTGTITSTGCTGTAEITLTVDNEAPVVDLDIEYPVLGCDGPLCTDIIATGADAYQWYDQFGTDLGTASSINVCPSQTTIYQVTGFDTQNDCHEDVQFTIEVQTGCSPCEVQVEESCTPEGYILLTAYNNGSPIVPPSSLDGFLRWYVDGVVHHNENPVIAYNNSSYSLEYELFDTSYPYDDHCEFKIPSTPVSIYCEGPCEDYSFIIASCNDDNDLANDLNFPSEHCNSMCTNGYGTIGVFGQDGNPLGSGYTISWNTGASTTFISGPSSNNYTVTITDESGCSWVGRYRLNCCMTERPTNVTCADLYKQCGPDGPIEPDPFSRRIVWDAVPGANYYELLFSFDGLSECCDISDPTESYTLIADFNYWEIPDDLDCFTVRIRAYCGGGIYSDSSDSYTYCSSTANCEREIVICHSCCPDRDGRLGDLSEFGEAFSTDKVIVYPNPTNGILNISSGQDLEEASIQIYNLLGQRVFESTLDHSKNNRIEILDLSDGVYLIHILKDNKVLQSEKLVIQAK